MRIKLAHLRDRSTSGGDVNFAIFDANASNGTDHGRAQLLAALTTKARQSGLRVEIAALVYQEHGELRTYGEPSVVHYVAARGIPRWTHTIDI